MLFGYSIGRPVGMGLISNPLRAMIATDDELATKITFLTDDLMINIAGVL